MTLAEGFWRARIDPLPAADGSDLLNENQTAKEEISDD